ncbi:MAG: translocation/assembly module TamB domain-containing protein, partial [Methylococcaceae bacterium]
RVTHPRYPLWLEGEGGWNGTDWHGDLRRVDFSHPLLGAWRVQAPASINLGTDGFKLGDTCWQSGSALWCAAARRVGERFELSIPNLAVHYRTPSTRVWQFRPEQAELKGSLHQGIAQFKLMLKDSAFADLSGELSTRTTADLPLSGQFRLNLRDLSVLEAREAHQPAQIEGLGQLDAEVGGTLHTPKLTLRGGITQASLSLPSLGLRLTDMALSLKPASDPPNRVEITGQARSGAGRIHLTGQAGLDAAQGWPWSVSLSGHNVQVSNTRMAEVTLDPQLQMEGDRQGIRLSGVATIPHARIVLPDYSVVKISPDTIRVGQTEEEKPIGLSLSSEVEVHLGEDVRFEGGGVKAKINGQLKIEQAAHEPGHASGEIRIKQGDYTFHTVKLPLTGGRLIYHHAALDNPELDFNVLREVDGIRAGIRVLGPLQKPGFNLYSDPVMPDSDILAYLISGKSLNLSSRQEGQIMQQAAASLSGPVGNLILREVTGRFGLEGLLDDVAVQTPTGTQGTALFLGKYLTPRLYLQYGVGLAQSSNVFRIRYELDKHWKIQSETGEYSGGDILFEMDK